MSSSSTGLHTQEGPGVDHWVAGEAPEELPTALTEFLARHRDGQAAAHEAHERSAHT